MVIFNVRYFAAPIHVKMQKKRMSNGAMFGNQNKNESLSYRYKLEDQCFAAQASKG